MNTEGYGNVMNNIKIEGMPEPDSLFPNEERYIAQLQQIFPTYDDLIVFAARMIHSESEMADEIDRQNKLLKEFRQAIQIFAAESKKTSSEAVAMLLEGFADTGNVAAKSILKGIDHHRRRASKSVVAQRIDQKLKPLWIQHCKDALSAEIQISRLADLFEFNGCSVDFKKHIDERTLKRWAKEVGVVLKAGRPAKL